MTTYVDVTVTIDARTRIHPSVRDRSFATVAGTLDFGEFQLTHDQRGDDAMSLPGFIAAMRAAIDDLESMFKRWDEERLRQASEDAAAERDDQELPPYNPNELAYQRPKFGGGPEYRHAPTGDHLLPTWGF